MKQVKKRTGNEKKIFADGNRLFLMALPFLVLVFVFSYIPVLGWIYAFFDYKPGIALSETSFVGLKYITMMFKEWSQVGDVLRNTLVLSGLTLLMLPLPMFFAIFLNEVRSRHFAKFVQTTTTLPNFISWIIVYMLTFSIFSMDGVLNTVLDKLGVLQMAKNYLGDEDIAWFFQTLLNVWKTVGWSAIIYISAIASIDQSLYDAAKVDGCGRWKSIRYITIPGLMPTFLVLFLLAIGNILSNGFDQYYVFWNPLVSEKLMVLDVYIYKMAFENMQISYSIALGMWKTAISICLLLFANFISKKIRGSSIF